MKHLVALLFFSSLVYAKRITCPDKKSSCPDTNTCCELIDGSYGCCVAKNGVCCDDHIHCCPQNTKCSNGDCIQTYVTNFTRPGLPLTPSNIVTCPSSNSTCPDMTTCCFDNPDTHSYKCCPLEDAVCCNDGVHCCPTGTVCNVAEQTCDGDRFKHTIFSTKKHKAVGYKHPTYSATNKKPVEWAKISMRQKFQKPGKVNSVVCPGSEFQCPNGYTCCKRPDGNWGCCPYENAFCCKDGLHCCSENMHCDETFQYCISDHSNVTSSESRPAQKITAKANSVVCPFSGFHCPDGDTCCKRPDGSWGCCPYENAFCCRDGLHCCPENTECDETSLHCISVLDRSNVTSSLTRPAQKIAGKANSVICPGSEFQCPDGYSCCKRPDGNWGCCPFENAFCCKDGLHCCPENMHCDATSQYCSQVDYRGRVLTAGSKIPAQKIETIASASTKKTSVLKVGTTCPDKSQCDDLDTCCKISASKYGCCHYANATCCSDRQHCCPQGYRCDVQSAKCLPKDE